MSMSTRLQMPSPLVSTKWLAENLGSADLRVLDCSVVMRPTDDGGYTFVGGRDEWQAGHIPTSVFVDVLLELADRDKPLPMMMPAFEQFAATMGRKGISNESRVVLYDRSNHAWAARVWWMLRAIGFDHAAVLDGGWSKWKAEGRAVSDCDDAFAAATLEAAPRPELFASKHDVLAAIESGDVALVNALSPEEHRGEKGRFARRGRIACSVNVYCQELIDADSHTYLDVDSLRDKFARAGVRAGSRAITYCGAGIAASSDALALSILGFDDVAVYDASLAEWANDERLPMESDV